MRKSQRYTKRDWELWQWSLACEHALYHGLEEPPPPEFDENDEDLDKEMEVW